MASLTVKTPTGTDAGTVDLDDTVFGVEPNVPVMHQVVTAQLAARRAGTQSTKTRADVRGGGAKPYRQKGTGNARQGSIRSPQFTGGGVAHGPKPRKFNQKTPKKMVKLALRSALSDRAADDKIVVVDSWGIDTPKTKTARQALAALGLDGSVLVVLGRDDEAAALSFRNLPNVQTLDVTELNAYDVLCADWVVFTKDTVPVDESTSRSTAAATTTAESGAAAAEEAAAESSAEESAAESGAAAAEESAAESGAAAAESAEESSAAADDPAADDAATENGAQS